MKRNYQPFLIFPNGDTKEVNPKNGTDFSLEELQGYVGGHIEIVRLGRGEIMVVNEEGKLQNLPCNELATTFFRFMRESNDHLVGNVLVCHTTQVK